jgi:acetyl-CoA carboxylase biotin carboxyl carrier protein
MCAAKNQAVSPDVFDVGKVRQLIELMQEHDLSELDLRQADDRMLVIKSPMVGTFYKASGPDSPPFVKVGDRIGPDKTVCIVEAMKVFNEIPAGVSGQVVAILVENGAPVEFGQPLLKVDPGA